MDFCEILDSGESTRLDFGAMNHVPTLRPIDLKVARHVGTDILRLDVQYTLSGRYLLGK